MFLKNVKLRPKKKKPPHLLDSILLPSTKAKKNRIKQLKNPQIKSGMCQSGHEFLSSLVASFIRPFYRLCSKRGFFLHLKKKKKDNKIPLLASQKLDLLYLQSCTRRHKKHDCLPLQQIKYGRQKTTAG